MPSHSNVAIVTDPPERHATQKGGTGHMEGWVQGGWCRVLGAWGVIPGTRNEAPSTRHNFQVTSVTAPSDLSARDRRHGPAMLRSVRRKPVFHEITMAFVGSGGDGAVAAADIIAGTCAGEGLHVIKTEAYGPQIRGGESSATVRVSSRPIHAPSDLVDVLVVFRWADFARFRDEMELSEDAIILHEPADAIPADLILPGRTFIGVPFDQTARDAGAPKSKNIVSVGAAAALCGLPAGAVRAAITKRFGKKAPAVIEANIRAFDLGNELPLSMKRPLRYEPGTSRLLMSGNEASAVAAIDAGCRFFAGYPITPSTEVLQYLAEWLPRLGGTVIQTEDELSAIGAIIGASFAGEKALTATSGPGLSLMSEMLGLASVAEIPAVIINVQRGGPSTGLPTKSEQSDLAHAVYASHGDTPRVVIACGDVEESYHSTIDAFNIAEEFQIPVIMLSDQSVAQRKQTLDASALSTGTVIGRRIETNLEDYRRYRLTDDGVSPMTSPGTLGGIYQTNGLEHDEQGRPSASFGVHETMNRKRYRKLDAIAAKYPLYTRFGAEDPEIGILCWGSSEGAVREAIDRLDGGGVRVAAFSPRMLMPLPAAQIQAFVDSCQQILVVELSHSGQFYSYLRTQIDLVRSRTRLFARSGGRALRASEVLRELRALVGISQEVEA